MDLKSLNPEPDILKARAERLAREAEEEARKLKQEEEEEEKQEKMLQSLCKDTLSSFGFSFNIFTKTISVRIYSSLVISSELEMETAQDDLALLLDVVTQYYNALNPYISVATNGCLECQSLFWGEDTLPLHKDGMKFISGKPFPKISVHLSVDEDSAEAAFLALENLGRAYIQMSQKYGDRMDKTEIYA